MVVWLEGGGEYGGVVGEKGDEGGQSRRASGDRWWSAGEKRGKG